MIKKKIENEKKKKKSEIGLFEMTYEGMRAWMNRYAKPDQYCSIPTIWWNISLYRRKISCSWSCETNSTLCICSSNSIIISIHCCFYTDLPNECFVFKYLLITSFLIIIWIPLVYRVPKRKRVGFCTPGESCQISFWLLPPFWFLIPAWSCLSWIINCPLIMTALWCDYWCGFYFYPAW